MSSVRYLKYKQENDLLILQLNIDEYKEIQNALQLLNKKRVIAKNYYYKIKQQSPPNKFNSKLSLLLPTIDLIENTN